MVSDIPREAVEELVEEGPFSRRFRYVLDGKVVGERHVSPCGYVERPLRDGRVHGRVIVAVEGRLDSVEPFVDGLPHGVASQYVHGRVIGTWRMRHGNGFDVWRHLRKDGSAYIAEIHELREGVHRTSWWFDARGRLVLVTGEPAPRPSFAPKRTGAARRRPRVVRVRGC